MPSLQKCLPNLVRLRLISRCADDRSGSKALLEMIRSHRIFSGQDEHESFKISNNYSSRYARKLIDEDKRFEQFFGLRELRSA